MKKKATKTSGCLCLGTHTSGDSERIDMTKLRIVGAITILFVIIIQVFSIMKNGMSDVIALIITIVAVLAVAGAMIYNPNKKK